MPEYSERMVRGYDYPVAKISAGRYCYRGRYIIRTSWEDEGPRGGTRYRWELANDDPHGGVTIDGVGGFRTMREAMSQIDDDRKEA